MTKILDVTLDGGDAPLAIAIVNFNGSQADVQDTFGDDLTYDEVDAYHDEDALLDILPDGLLDVANDVVTKFCKMWLSMSYLKPLYFDNDV